MNKGGKEDFHDGVENALCDYSRVIELPYIYIRLVSTFCNWLDMARIRAEKRSLVPRFKNSYSIPCGLAERNPIVIRQDT